MTPAGQIEHERQADEHEPRGYDLATPLVPVLHRFPPRIRAGLAVALDDAAGDAWDDAWEHWTEDPPRRRDGLALAHACRDASEYLRATLPPSYADTDDPFAWAYDRDSKTWHRALDEKPPRSDEEGA